jgi:hypothetical protein
MWFRFLPRTHGSWTSAEQTILSYPVVQVTSRVHTTSNPRDFQISILVVNLYNINDYLHQTDLLFY